MSKHNEYLRQSFERTYMTKGQKQFEDRKNSFQTNDKIQERIFELETQVNEYKEIVNELRKHIQHIEEKSKNELLVNEIHDKSNT